MLLAALGAASVLGYRGWYQRETAKLLTGATRKTWDFLSPLLVPEN